MFNNQYPEYKVVKYPKAGETNPIIKLYARNIGDNVNKEVKPPKSVTDWEEYIYTVADWTDTNVLR